MHPYQVAKGIIIIFVLTHQLIGLSVAEFNLIYSYINEKLAIPRAFAAGSICMHINTAVSNLQRLHTWVFLILK